MSSKIRLYFSKELKARYLKFIIPIKIQIDNIEFLEDEPLDKDLETIVKL